MRVLTIIPKGEKKTGKVAQRRKRRLTETTIEAERQLNLFSHERGMAIPIRPSRFGQARLLKARASEQARETYENAISRGVAVPETHVKLGALLFKEGLWHQARRHFARALALEPDRVDAHYNLAHLYIGMDLFGSASVHLRIVTGQDPAFGPGHFYLALVGLQEGDYDLARKSLKAFEQTNAKEADVARLRSLVQRAEANESSPG